MLERMDAHFAYFRRSSISCCVSPSAACAFNDACASSERRLCIQRCRYLDIAVLQISENLSLCDFPRSGTALWRGRKAPAGPGTGGAQGARILRGAAPEAGTPHQGPSSRHPPAVWRRARRGLRLLGTRHVPASRHASARGTARVPGARRGALAAPLLGQTRGG